jgi:tetratricopeptide (TPR) repeat protein
MILQNDEKVCPFCYEFIKQQAIRCKHCQADLGSRASGGASASYDTAGGDYGFAMGGVGHHIEGGIHITNLADLDEMDEAKKRELLSLYENQVRTFPERAQVHFALGLSYLDLRLYDQALASLKQALGKGSREAGLYYYISLASLGGKRPRGQSFAKIKEIETYLEASIRTDNGHAQAMVLWAIVKYDYYLANGLKVSPPRISELLNRARGCIKSHDEIQILLRHISLPASTMRSIAESA